MWNYRQRITAKDKMLFFRQLATLLTAGMPLLQGLQAVRNSVAKQGMRTLLDELCDAIRRGNSLSSVMAQYPKHFDTFSRELIVAGELSGRLGDMLLYIAIHQEKSAHLRRKIQKAFLYPSVVFLVAIAVTVVLLHYVVPQFANLFAGFGAKLPALTRVVITVANGLEDYGGYGLLCLAGVVCLFLCVKRCSRHFALWCDGFLLRAPVVGGMVKIAMAARFSRTVAIVLDSGVPLLEGLESLGHAMTNLAMRSAMGSVHDTVREGKCLHKAMRETGMFPHIAVEMVAIGEEVGKLSRMLEKTAELYEEELGRLADKLGQLLEPLIMVILGLIIGGLVVAMYLPVFKLGTVI